MSEVLVLVDHADGTVRKTTAELLTIARRLGEPSAVFIGAGVEDAEVAETVQAVRRGEGLRPRRRRAQATTWWRPKAEALAQLVARRSRPRPDPVERRGQGDRGPAGDQAESGLITDAVDVAGRVGPGDHAVGVRRQLHRPGEGHPGHADHHRQAERRHPGGADGAGTVEEFEATISDAAKTAQIVTVAAARGDRPPRADRGRDRGVRRPWHRRQLRARSRASPTPSVQRSARPAPRSTPAGTRTPTRSARPARPSRRSCTSRPASPAPSSTGPACRPRRRSSPSTRTRRRRSSSWSTSASSATSTRCCPQPTEEINQRKG